MKHGLTLIWRTILWSTRPGCEEQMFVFFISLSLHISSQVDLAVVQALSSWSAATSLTFTETKGDADINISFDRFYIKYHCSWQFLSDPHYDLDAQTGRPFQWDFDSTEYGHAFSPVNPFQPGDVHINKEFYQIWRPGPSLEEVLPGPEFSFYNLSFSFWLMSLDILLGSTILKVITKIHVNK